MISEEKTAKESATHGRVYPAVPLSYQPERWNADSVVFKFNCYAYALDTQGFGWLPLWGYLAGQRQIVKFPLSDEFRFRASPSLRSDIWLGIDGLKQIRKHEYGPGEKHIIAYDSYAQHFYRLDEGNVWSHKLGMHPATNRDDAGRIIHDLEGAAFDVRDNPDYGGVGANMRYFILPDEGIRIMNAAAREGVSYQRILQDHTAPAPSYDDRGKTAEQILREVDALRSKIDANIHRRTMQGLAYKFGAIEP